MTAVGSGPPLPERLGIVEGMEVALLHAPDGFDALLGELPPGVDVRHGLRKSDRVDLIVGFVTERAHLERNVDWLLATLPPTGTFWVVWPPTSSEVPTDMTADVVREVALSRGWVDGDACAIDEGWSGLGIRLRDEPGSPT